MLLSKEYVGYLAREVTKKLIAGKAIETSVVPKVTERVHAALLEELTLEDRINDEVRVILEAPELDTVVNFMLEFLARHIGFCPAIGRNNSFISLRTVVDDGPNEFKIAIITAADHELRGLSFVYAVLHSMFRKQLPADTGHSIRSCFFPRNMWATWPAKLPRN